MLTNYKDEYGEHFMNGFSKLQLTGLGCELLFSSSLPHVKCKSSFRDFYFLGVWEGMGVQVWAYLHIYQCTVGKQVDKTPGKPNSTNAFGSPGR